MLPSHRKPTGMSASLLARGRGNAELLDAPRPPLRRLADCWGLTPGIGAAVEELTLTARDGTRLAASYLPGPAARSAPRRPAGEGAGLGPAVLIAPGFAGHRTKPAYALLAERLASRVAVLALDLRGHGGSGGRCTFGVREVLDIAAAADWLRARGHGWVGAIGASMGGAAVLRASGLSRGGRFDAVCAISSPATWGPGAGAPDPGHDPVDGSGTGAGAPDPGHNPVDGSGPPAGAGDSRHGAVAAPRRAETPAMRGINRTVTVGWYRALVGTVLHVRIAANPWAGGAAPAPPLALVGHIAPVPLLLVHGDDDHYFPPSEAELLHAAAAHPRALWREPAGFGHAEDGLRRPFVDDLADAVVACATSGSWPAHR